MAPLVYFTLSETLCERLTTNNIAMSPAYCTTTTFPYCIIFLKLLGCYETELYFNGHP